MSRLLCGSGEFVWFVQQLAAFLFYRLQLYCDHRTAWSGIRFTDAPAK